MHSLVSRLVGDGEGQSETRVLINRTAAVFTAHAADGREPYETNTDRASGALRGRRDGQSTRVCLPLSSETLGSRLCQVKCEAGNPCKGP